ncbi:(2Fe-2S)-binding protein [Solimonas variicoloris]|uniref:(2Fe-2S)-binding protein n=1 Tax=Solimonas variicoloris TaxID=254408 RepID=UPI000368862C|nr:(2Fe-2S)-binding protein [Solimonas variicoloris]
MYICVCKAVSDRAIRRAVRQDGVTSLRELAQMHGVGTCCGKCVPQARELLGEALREEQAAIPLSALTPALLGT